jgi:hypothetical protein
MKASSTFWFDKPTEVRLSCGAQVYPEKGTVSFSAGLHGWAFTLTVFADLYAKKFGVEARALLPTAALGPLLFSLYDHVLLPMLICHACVHAGMLCSRW